MIYKYHPFTIQLTYTTGETKQDCHIGIDTGSKYIGAAVRSEDKVLERRNRASTGYQVKS